MVVLLRSAGLPARIVNGFAGGHDNRVGGFLEVAQSDAHTWVEVPFEGAGWVRYDPTPADLRLASADALRGSARWAELASAIELWWFRNVVDFDRGHQARAVRKAWLAWHRWKNASAAPAALDEDHVALWLPTAPLWALGALTVAAAAWAWARRRVRQRRPHARLPAAYAQALRLLARRGYQRREADTARGFAEIVTAGLPPDASAAFRRLTDAYLAERFGAAAPGGEAAELRALRDSLRR
jgi:hypothetical protein